MAGLSQVRDISQPQTLYPQKHSELNICTCLQHPRMGMRMQWCSVTMTDWKFMGLGSPAGCWASMTQKERRVDAYTMPTAQLREITLSLLITSQASMIFRGRGPANHSKRNPNSASICTHTVHRQSFEQSNTNIEVSTVQAAKTKLTTRWVSDRHTSLLTLVVKVGVFIPSIPIKEA